MSNTNGTLLTHCGAVKLSRADLARIEPPARTATWQPVQHAALVETVQTALAERGLTVVREEYAMQRAGALFFGVMDLSRERDDFRAALGVRAANDKSMAIQVAVGLRVFVCDNLAFRGDLIALRRKHTAGLDLAKEVRSAVARFEQHFARFEHETDALKALVLTEDRAKALIHDAFLRRLLPLRLLPAVSKEYFDSGHEAFRPRTAWSLANAFTEAVKVLPDAPRFRALLGLGRLFGAALN